MKMHLKDLSVKLQSTVQTVFTSCKIAQEFPTGEPKPQLIDQQCIVYQFECDQCDAGYVRYTRGHLFVCVDGHRIEARPRQCINIMIIDTQAWFRMTFTIALLKVLKKCQNKFDCLVNEMLLIKQLRPW